MSRDHICVCVCTYKRPESLKRLLETLQLQDTRDVFDFSVVVVDNDRGRSAEHVVQAFGATAKPSVTYQMEPEANIAIARNRTLEQAHGQYVAFIDDDEYPETSWLLALYETSKRFDAEAVIGVVRPDFEFEPPAWVRHGRFFFKPVPPVPPSGTPLSAGITSNALVSRNAIRQGNLAFDPAFGRSGGEDDKFFIDFLAQGFKLVFCADAIVHETIPADRVAVSYLWKRLHLQGQTFIRIARLTGKRQAGLAGLLKSVAGTVAYAIALPVCLLRGRHVAIDYWLRIAWHLGFIAGFLHWRILADREQFEGYMQQPKLAQDKDRS